MNIDNSQSCFLAVHKKSIVRRSFIRVFYHVDPRRIFGFAFFRDRQDDAPAGFIPLRRKIISRNKRFPKGTHPVCRSVIHGKTPASIRFLEKSQLFTIGRPGRHFPVDTFSEQELRLSILYGYNPKESGRPPGHDVMLIGHIDSAIGYQSAIRRDDRLAPPCKTHSGQHIFSGKRIRDIVPGYPIRAGEKNHTNQDKPTEVMRGDFHSRHISHILKQPYHTPKDFKIFPRGTLEVKFMLFCSHADMNRAETDIPCSRVAGEPHETFVA